MLFETETNKVCGLKSLTLLSHNTGKEEREEKKDENV